MSAAFHRLVTCLAAVVSLAACGRLSFEPRGNVLADGASGDAVLPFPMASTYMKSSNSDAGDRFGNAVAISADGTVLAISAFQEASSASGVGGAEASNAAPGSGAVYIFVRTASEWEQRGYLKASNTEINDQFGFSLALSSDGHTLAVGAPLEASGALGIDGNQTANTAPASGAVFVFTDAGGTWTQQAYVKASNSDISDQFGYALGLSGSGDTLVVNSRKEDSAATGVNGNQADNTFMDSGALFVFQRTGGAWAQQAYLKPTVIDGNDEFGRTVAIADDGNTIVAGAPYEKSPAIGIDGTPAMSGATNSGAAYVFTRVGTAWSQTTYLKASNTGINDEFGYSVAISGDGTTIAVGAHREASTATGIDGNQGDNASTNSGAVYVFVRTGATWRQDAYVKASNTDANDRFGGAMALSARGERLVIGAAGEASNARGIDGDATNDTASASGAVYLYARDATGWRFASYLKASNSEAADRFGDALDIAGATGGVVVGAPDEDGGARGVSGDESSNAGDASGAAYVFE